MHIKKKVLNKNKIITYSESILNKLFYIFATYEYSKFINLIKSINKLLWPI